MHGKSRSFLVTLAPTLICPGAFSISPRSFWPLAWASLRGPPPPVLELRSQLDYLFDYYCDLFWINARSISESIKSIYGTWVSTGLVEDRWCSSASHEHQNFVSRRSTRVSKAPPEVGRTLDPAARFVSTIRASPSRLGGSDFDVQVEKMIMFLPPPVLVPRTSRRNFCSW
jgi:hypothetical protein